MSQIIVNRKQRLSTGSRNRKAALSLPRVTGGRVVADSDSWVQVCFNVVHSAFTETYSQKPAMQNRRISLLGHEDNNTARHRLIRGTGEDTDWTPSGF